MTQATGKARAVAACAQSPYCTRAPCTYAASHEAQRYFTLLRLAVLFPVLSEAVCSCVGKGCVVMAPRGRGPGGLAKQVGALFGHCNSPEM